MEIASLFTHPDHPWQEGKAFLKKTCQARGELPDWGENSPGLGTKSKTGDANKMMKGTVGPKNGKDVSHCIVLLSCIWILSFGAMQIRSSRCIVCTGASQLQTMGQIQPNTCFHKLYWNKPHSLIYILSTAGFVLRWQSWAVVSTEWHTKLKIFTMWLFTEKACPPQV